MKIGKLRLEDMESKLDLNLLKVLILLERHRNLKTVAAKLGKTESAVSKHLSRLREQLDDPLFVRGNQGLEPTTFTLNSIPVIQKAFNLIDEAFEPLEFNACEYQRTINIALHINTLELHGKRIHNELRDRFPMSQIRIQAWGENTERRMIEGDIDLGIHFLNKNRSQAIHQQLLIRDKVVVGVHHSHFHPRLNWDEVIKWPFVMVRTIGWNDERFHYIETLCKDGIDIKVSSVVDSAAVGLEILRDERAACITAQSLLPKDFHLIDIPQQYHMDFGIVACYPRTKRDSPLISCLIEEILAIIQ